MRRSTLQAFARKAFARNAFGLSALALLAGAPAAAAAAAAAPDLDIEKTCKSANKANVGVSDNANEEGCLRSERAARTEAERRWGDYTPAAKSQCENQFKAGGYPSYVEMVTCLELASGTAPSGTGGGSEARPAPRDAGAGTLTREPPASQRTNPIEILEKR